jgi:hypothetical protein
MKFLLNVGAEKAGTTWLYEYFRSHPQFYDVGKELNAIQRDDLVPAFAKVADSFRHNINNYFSYFQRLNQVSGDFTHYEGSTENIFRLLKQGLGQYDIEIVPVYIMRDPIQRAWSAWHMLGGGFNFSMSPACQFVMQNHLECKYKETVEALRNVFAEPLFFFYEDFFRQEHVDLICDKLEIGRYEVLDRVINRGKYDRVIPQEFINKFCLTPKNISAVKYVSEVFDNVPWAIEDYKEINTK